MFCGVSKGCGCTIRISRSGSAQRLNVNGMSANGSGEGYTSIRLRGITAVIDLNGIPRCVAYGIPRDPLTVRGKSGFCKSSNLYGSGFYNGRRRIIIDLLG